MIITIWDEYYAMQSNGPLPPSNIVYYYYYYYIQKIKSPAHSMLFSGKGGTYIHGEWMTMVMYLP